MYGRAIAEAEQALPPLAQAGVAWLAMYQTLAWAYTNRGVAREALGEPQAAEADHSKAIALREALRRQVAQAGAAWPAQYQHDLATAYSNLGNARHAMGEQQAAEADYSQAIALRESLRQQLAQTGAAWPAEYQNLLASAYTNRGVAREAQGEAQAAEADYSEAIALGEALRQQLAQVGAAWPAKYQYDLALAYSNRGTSRHVLGEQLDAVADYSQAIALREALRQQLARAGAAWPAKYQNDLASAYSNRGAARHELGEQLDAVADCSQAIALSEALRQQLAQAGTAWSAEYQSLLASAYTNRGAARDALGEQQAAETDYSQAIALRGALRQQLAQAGAAWPAKYQNDLASAHSNRGNARHALAEPQAAEADHGRSIALREALRRQVAQAGAAWPAQYQHDLASAYYNCGNARNDLGKQLDAVADYSQAIALGEALRQQLAQVGAAWPAKYQSLLASAYTNRGAARDALGEPRAAETDCSEAIALGEALRQQLAQAGAAWPAKYQYDLALAYSSHGNSRYVLGEQLDAVADYSQAIALGEALRQQLAQAGAAWPAKYQNDLASAYSNRGAARNDLGKQLDAVADCSQAIALSEALRQQLAQAGAAWPVEYQYRLAVTYYNRGNARRALGEQQDAVADYSQAIALGEALRQQQAQAGQSWSGNYWNLLVGSYINRGLASDALGNQEAAIADYTAGIGLGEALRQHLKSADQDWPVDSRAFLFNGYLNRGKIHRAVGTLPALRRALADFTQAVMLSAALPPEQLQHAERQLQSLAHAAATAYTLATAPEAADPSRARADLALAREHALAACTLARQAQQRFGLGLRAEQEYAFGVAMQVLGEWSVDEAAELAWACLNPREPGAAPDSYTMLASARAVLTAAVQRQQQQQPARHPVGRAARVLRGLEKLHTLFHSGGSASTLRRARQWAAEPATQAQARATLLQLAEQRPAEPDPWLALAQLHQRTGLPEQALRALKTAVPLLIDQLWLASEAPQLWAKLRHCVWAAVQLHLPLVPAPQARAQMLAGCDAALAWLNELAADHASALGDEGATLLAYTTAQAQAQREVWLQAQDAARDAALVAAVLQKVQQRNQQVMGWLNQALDAQLPAAWSRFASELLGALQAMQEEWSRNPQTLLGPRPPLAGAATGEADTETVGMDDTNDDPAGWTELLSRRLSTAIEHLAQAELSAAATALATELGPLWPQLSAPEQKHLQAAWRMRQTPELQPFALLSAAQVVELALLDRLYQPLRAPATTQPSQPKPPVNEKAPQAWVQRYLDGSQPYLYLGQLVAVFNQALKHDLAHDAQHDAHAAPEGPAARLRQHLRTWPAPQHLLPEPASRQARAKNLNWLVEQRNRVAHPGAQTTTTATADAERAWQVVVGSAATTAQAASEPGFVRYFVAAQAGLLD